MTIIQSSNDPFITLFASRSPLIYKVIQFHRFTLKKATEIGHIIDCHISFETALCTLILILYQLGDVDEYTVVNRNRLMFEEKEACVVLVLGLWMSCLDIL